MVGTDIESGGPQKNAGKGLKRPERRGKVRIDMTPMVDIAFLLLIFYMVTTVFSRPTRMEFSIPSKLAVTDTIPYGESRLLRIFVDKDDSLYYQIGKTMEYPDAVGFDELARIVASKNRTIDGLAMLLKLDQDASYESMVRIIDLFQNTERSIKAEIGTAGPGDSVAAVNDFSARFVLQNMTAYDEYLLDMANKERRNVK